MKITTTTTVLGLELHHLGDQRYSARCCVLTQKSSQLFVGAMEVLTGTLAEILNQLPKNNPVSLAFTGRGLVQKNQLLPPAHTPQDLFSTVFPSIDQQQFYAQFFRNGEFNSISIARKEEIDGLLNKLDAAGVNVLMLAFGPILTETIWPQLNQYGNELVFDGHVFSLSAEKNLMAYHYDQSRLAAFPIKIGANVIPETNLVAYAAAFQFLLCNKIDPVLADVDTVNERFKIDTHYKTLKRKAMWFLTGLFVALLFSFLTFTHYNQKNAELVKQLGSKTANIDQIDFLRKEIAQNELLLKQLNWANGYNYGYLLHEIGRQLPRQLTLTEVTVNQFKTEKEQTDRLPTINIVGYTDQLMAVNNWIYLLKEEKWVKSVRLMKYQEKETSEVYQFNLTIQY